MIFPLKDSYKDELSLLQMATIISAVVPLWVTNLLYIFNTDTKTI